MKWIELIVVRAADKRHIPTVRRLVAQLASGARPDGLAAITLYGNAFVRTDMGIHLEWARQEDKPLRSDIGIELAAALEEFGRVHHTLWIEDIGAAGQE